MSPPSDTQRDPVPGDAFAGVLLALSVVTVVLAGCTLLALWPPTPLTAALLAGIGLLALAATTLQLLRLRAVRRREASPQFMRELADLRAASAQVQAREQAVRRRADQLELREQRIGRRLRALHLAELGQAVDVADSEHSEEALLRLVRSDRALIALIEAESQRAFDNILANRYAAGDGNRVHLGLVMQDLGEFVESVARLYRSEGEAPLLDTEIERVVLAASSTALHVLVVVDALPINVKSWNVQKLYRQMRRAVSYYGTYKAAQPYLDLGMGLLQFARFAFGANPLTAGATWVTGKLAARGVARVTEKVLHQQALQLLHDLIRIIGFEVAMLYGGGFRHRDANWVLAAELVNLEVARGGDLRGRDEAIRLLSAIALRHEFDRLLLFRALGNGKVVDVTAARPQTALTDQEREGIAAQLEAHIRATAVVVDGADVSRWRYGVEQRLGVRLGETAAAAPPSASLEHRVRRVAERVRRKLKTLREKRSDG